MKIFDSLLKYHCLPHTLTHDKLYVSELKFHLLKYKFKSNWALPSSCKVLIKAEPIFFFMDLYYSTTLNAGHQIPKFLILNYQQVLNDTEV